MTEQEKAEQGNRSLHLLMRLIVENPISALNTAALIFGGGYMYSQMLASVDATNQSVIEMKRENDHRVARIERQLNETNAATTAKDDRTRLRIETITDKLGKVEVSVGRIESSLEYLVRQSRQNERRQ